MRSEDEDAAAGGQAMGPARLFLMATIVALLALQLHLALAMGVNWDEFHYLAQVHAYARGEVLPPLNTLHVHLFQWLRAVPGGEVNQVVAGRLVMLALEVGTAFFIARIAGRFFSRETALMAAIAYLSFGAVMVHGASFRTDPSATFLSMGALWLIVCSGLRGAHAVAVGVLVALAGLVTIKSVFYLPTLAVAVGWRLATSPEPRRLLGRLALGALAGCAVMGGLLAWHTAGLAADPVAASADMAGRAYRKTVLTGAFFPRWAELEVRLLRNPLHWLLMAAGVTLAARAAVRDRQDRWRWIAVLALAAPLLTLAFYRNAFPYFYAFLLAPVSVLTALALERWRTSAGVLALAAVGLLASGVVNYAAYVQRGQETQRAVVAAVHRMFPEPVPYIERAAMIASFPHRGIFMTTWGMDKYRQAGVAVLKGEPADEPPVFMIAGHFGLVAAVEGADASHPGALLPQDAAFLRENFIRHWGPIWVAGKTLAPGEARFDILIPGPYTVEGAAPVQIDGKPRQPGSTVELKRGAHAIDNDRPVTLRWGDHLHRPTEPAPTAPLYWGF